MQEAWLAALEGRNPARAVNTFAAARASATAGASPRSRRGQCGPSASRRSAPSGPPRRRNARRDALMASLSARATPHA
jgi:hypothetical protein